jgi:hypothetical protein
MLMRPPSPESPLSGWMFEYPCEAPLAVIDEPVISRMWTFKEARKFEDPKIEEEKDTVGRAFACMLLENLFRQIWDLAYSFELCF